MAGVRRAGQAARRGGVDELEGSGMNRGYKSGMRWCAWRWIDMVLSSRLYSFNFQTGQKSRWDHRPSSHSAIKKSMAGGSPAGSIHGLETKHRRTAAMPWFRARTARNPCTKYRNGHRLELLGRSRVDRIRVKCMGLQLATE